MNIPLFSHHGCFFSNAFSTWGGGRDWEREGGARLYVGVGVPCADAGEEEGE